MSQIAYTVIVSIRYASKQEEWLNWMRQTHIADVLASGAQSAEIVKLAPEREGQPETIFEVRYKFKDKDSFDHYITQHAPRLRQESLEHFPFSDGFSYQRTIGEVL